VRDFSVASQIRQVTSQSLIVDIAYNAYVRRLKGIPLSTKVPEQVWSEVEQFMREEKLDKSAAVEKLLWAGLERWRQSRALDQATGQL
jgi:hypothetical protein